MFFFVILCQIIGFSIVGDICVLRDHTFPAKKKEKTKARQGHIKQVRKISGSLSQKRRGHLDVCAVKCKNRAFAS